MAAPSFIAPLRRPRRREPDTRAAAWLGLALGVTFSLCFATGLWSHLAQDPPSWFSYPARPAGLYRVTQGVHVASGTASIPLLLAKLWTVHPRLVEWPPARSALHAVERLALLPLVGGGLFLVLSGTANVARWYPWRFFFPRAHFWAAWITIGALVVHVGAKAATTWTVVRAIRGDADGGRGTGADRHPATDAFGAGAGDPAHTGDDAGDRAAEEDARADDPADRRAFLAGVAVASGVLVVATAGGTVPALSPASVLAQRRPGQGPQGVPVNKTAVSAGVVDAATDPAYRLVVERARGRDPVALSLADLRALPLHEATLPIACVEGWSASARWRGVRVRDLLDLAGADDADHVVVESLQPGGRYRASDLNAGQIRDRDTLLALDLDGEPLALDHGYPVRLIGPNRPGVLQTKWVARLVVA